MPHPILDAAWFEITAFLTLVILTIALGIWLEHKHKTSRLDNKTDDFIKLKHWGTRKDGMK